MSLALHMSLSFAPPVRARGEAYIAEGRVRMLQGSATHARAVVSGTEEYEVHLTLRDTSVVARCGCPYAQTDLCKHIWAVICAADRAGHLGEAGKRSSSIDLVLGTDDRADPADDDGVLLVVAAAAND